MKALFAKGSMTICGVVEVDIVERAGVLKDDKENRSRFVATTSMHESATYSTRLWATAMGAMWELARGPGRGSVNFRIVKCKNLSCWNHVKLSNHHIQVP